VQSCGFFGLGSATIPCFILDCFAGFACRFAVLKIEAEEFFPLKSRGLIRHKTLPHNFVHRKCEETHSGVESVWHDADGQVAGRRCGTGQGRRKTGRLAEADWALHHFRLITLELAQKAGGIINAL
jgi:hypothetical protein